MGFSFKSEKLVFAILFLFLWPSNSHAQYITQSELSADDNQIVNTLKRRLVLISYEYQTFEADQYGRPKAIGPTKNVYGVGFFISKNGLLMTARHVVEKLYEASQGKNIQIKNKKFISHLLHNNNVVTVPLQDPKFIYFPPNINDHLTADLAVLRISPPSEFIGIDFEHFCISDDYVNINKASGSLFAVKAKQLGIEDTYSIDRSIEILDTNLSSDFSNHWRATATFYSSESGSPAIYEGKVVGIVSTGWDYEHEKPVPEGGFIFPISRGFDPTWLSPATETPCTRPNHIAFPPAMHQSEFRKKFPQGFAAWQKDANGIANTRNEHSDHFVFDTGKGETLSQRVPSFIIRKSQLQKSKVNWCKAKFLRIAFNHFYSAKKTSYSIDGCTPVNPNSRTFYSVQALPKFSNEITESIISSIYLFRKDPWFRSREDGSKYETRDFCQNSNCGKSINIEPKNFSQMHSYPYNELEEIESFLGNNIWHGSPRISPDAGSTYAKNRNSLGFWKVSSNQLEHTQNLNLKNFIIPYVGIENISTKGPPAIELCVDEHWEYLDIEWNSYERCVGNNHIRIYFE